MSRDRESGNVFADLSGQVAVVTGGATGIGAATVRQLVSLGARVGCCFCKSRDNAERLAEELNSREEVVFPVRLDVTDDGQVRAGIDAVAEKIGDTVHILVNNAGDMSDPTAIESMSEEMWNAEIGLNLTSAFLCSRHCIPAMKAKQYGRIINNTSLAAV